jgi:adenylyltransferase/sulfurtransferase
MSEQFARQLVIPDIGQAGQAKLERGRALVVGAGGLGSPILLYLAAAGVGTLGIADNDQVSLSNLNRQILYSHDNLGRSKVLVAVQRVRDLNPSVRAIPYEERVLYHNGLNMIPQYDLVIDASDNLETKSLLNELCVATGIPLVWGAVARFDGQMSTYMPGYACRSCIFPRNPQPGTYPTPAELGVVGAAAGVMGSLQALEAIKVLLGIGEPLLDRLLLWEGLTGAFDVVRIDRHPQCPVCGASYIGNSSAP